jgi:hypothetical protein
MKRQFQDAEGAEAVRFSHGDFGFVVEALDYLNAAGELLSGLEVVEQQRTVGAPHPGHFLHRLDPRTHGLTAPEFQEHPSPGG